MADPPGGRPVPLRVATGVLAAQALALLGFAGWLVWETVVATPDNPAVAQGSAAYFVVLALILCGVAWALARRHGWAGGAAVFVQLLALPMAWYMGRAGLLVGAVPLAAGALAALVGLLTPASRAALGR